MKNIFRIIWNKMNRSSNSELELVESFLKKANNKCQNSDNQIIYNIAECKENFSFWIFNVMIGMMIEYEMRGCNYSLNVVVDEEGYNLWNAFFQPRGIHVDNAIKSNLEVKNVDLGGRHLINPDQFDIYNKRSRKSMEKIFAEYGRFNDNMHKYVDEEYSTLLKGRKVLGILYRGTDYTKLKPVGHPVQPTLEQLEYECRKRLKRGLYKYIYITTDEKKAIDFFKEKFPNHIILENKRTYFDEFYDDYNCSYIASCHHNRNNDRYLTAKEYISSVYLLSKCNELIAGNCGGSRAAIYFSGGKYRKIKLFNLGVY